MANVKDSRQPSAKENPTVISDSGRIRIGSVSPAFPPVRGSVTTCDAGKVRIGSLSPDFPPLRDK